MDDWIYGVLLIVSAVTGAFAGIYGQSLKEWFSRPKLTAHVEFVNKDQIILYIQNNGRKSTRDLSILLGYLTSKDGCPFLAYFYKDRMNDEIGPNNTGWRVIGSVYDDLLYVCTNYAQDVMGTPIQGRAELELPKTIIAVIGAQDIEGANYEIVVDKDEVKCRMITIEEFSEIVKRYGYPER